MRISPTGRRFIFGSAAHWRLFCHRQRACARNRRLQSRPEPAWVRVDRGQSRWRFLRTSPLSTLLEDRCQKPVSAQRVTGNSSAHVAERIPGAGLTRSFPSFRSDFEPSYFPIVSRFEVSIRGLSRGRPGRCPTCAGSPAVKMIAKRDDSDESDSRYPARWPLCAVLKITSSRRR